MGNCNSNGRPFRTCHMALLHFRKCPCLVGLRWLHSQATWKTRRNSCFYALTVLIVNVERLYEPKVFKTCQSFERSSVGSVELFQFVDDPKRPPGDFANAGVFGIPNRISPERDFFLFLFVCFRSLLFDKAKSVILLSPALGYCMLLSDVDSTFL